MWWLFTFRFCFVTPHFPSCSSIAFWRADKAVQTYQCSRRLVDLHERSPSITGAGLTDKAGKQVALLQLPLFGWCHVCYITCRAMQFPGWVAINLRSPIWTGGARESKTRVFDEVWHPLMSTSQCWKLMRGGNRHERGEGVPDRFHPCQTAVTNRISNELVAEKSLNVLDCRPTKHPTILWLFLKPLKGTVHPNLWCCHLFPFVVLFSLWNTKGDCVSFCSPYSKCILPEWY